MASNQDYHNALMIALNVFQGEIAKGEKNSEALKEKILDLVLSWPSYKDLQRQQLRLAFEEKVNVIVSVPQILEDDEGHEPWLLEKKAQIQWSFWHRYRRYLLEGKGWSPAVIQSIDEVTDDVLQRLEDPTNSARAFDRRGMVVGHVQSGKTANFTGLICKAVDAGYKLIIVLAGQHNSLRSQTQMRLDEEFLGVDTAQFTRGDTPNGRIGVGVLPGEERLPVISLTSRLENGDFHLKLAESTTIPLGGTPVLLVVKKNGRVLSNLHRYLAQGQHARTDPATGRQLVEGVPLLLIDDEADYASVNTREVPVDDKGVPLDDYSPARINEILRGILHTFSQKAYVGYTATPFANIFIHPEGKHKSLGPDLFPRSFIISLPTPSNYTGPVEVFGLADGRRQAQPVIRPVQDHQGFMPDGHKKDHHPASLAPTLKEAMRAFILSCAIRRVRGQKTVHNSMLIHITRFTNVQTQVRELVKQEFDEIRNQLRYGDGDRKPTIRDELHELWQRDFVKTSRLMGKTHPGETWEVVDGELLPAVEKVKIKTINGTSEDILDYKDNASQGLNVIAIGGDKLSRGLTLDGLTVSYYLRASKMYDTLMQMGRWFGYRSGYEDLCRIYTTEELSEWYQHIAEASEELRAEFDYMVSIGATPDTYGLRVRSHPVLMVTSPVKMRTGETLQLSYDGKIPETTVYDPSPDVLDRNYARTDAFLRKLGKPEAGSSGNLVWRAVQGPDVAAFVRGFSTHRNAPAVNGARMAEYIDAQLARSELTDWTIVLLNKRGKERDAEDPDDAGPGATARLGGHEVVTTRRGPVAYRRGSHFSIRRLVSPTHEAIDLTPEELVSAEEQTRRLPRNKDVPASASIRLDGRAIRAARPETRGLLLLYPLDPSNIRKEIREPPEKKRVSIAADPSFELTQVVMGLAISFPSSEHATRIAYEVNNVWQKQEQEDLL